MNDVADAIREVTARVQRAIDKGCRSRAIDADDLIEVLLSIADELDPPLADLVRFADACPHCGEREPVNLIWQDDETVRCGRCGTEFRPGGKEG